MDNHLFLSIFFSILYFFCNQIIQLDLSFDEFNSIIYVINDHFLIVDKLNVKKELIKVSLIGNKKHEKFSESDKIQKEYVHYFYKVDLNEKLNNEEFEINGIQYKWFSYANLLKDKRIQQVNSDIVQFVKEFDI